MPRFIGARMKKDENIYSRMTPAKAIKMQFSIEHRHHKRKKREARERMRNTSTGIFMSIFTAIKSHSRGYNNKIYVCTRSTRDTKCFKRPFFSCLLKKRRTFIRIDRTSAMRGSDRTLLFFL